MAVGGGSADRKAEELAAAGDPSAGAWAAGAAGERRVAAALAELSEAWTVLHDRLLSPGLSPVNLDHVVVGPGGAFLIDAKNWGGAITAWQGNLYQHLGAGESRRSLSKHQEVAKVHRMATDMADESGMPVTPVICLAGRAESEFGDPQLIRGVWAVPASMVTQWLESRPAVLERGQVERASVTLMTSFPSTTTDALLLAAMGASAARSKPRRKRGRRRQPKVLATRPPGRPTGHTKQVLGRLLALALTLTAAVVAVKSLPGFMLDGVAGATGPGTSASPPTAAGGPSSSPSVSKSTAPKQRPSPTSPPAVPVTRCANLTPAQVSKIIGRTVHPVASGGSCAWGTRLDDGRTTLVEVRAMAKHPTYERNFVISESQSRTVFGSSFVNYTQGTALWVAAGQPIGTGKRPVNARLAIHVSVATKELKVSDDRARSLAAKIAVAVNAAE